MVGYKPKRTSASIQSTAIKSTASPTAAPIVVAATEDDSHDSPYYYFDDDSSDDDDAEEKPSAAMDVDVGESDRSSAAVASVAKSDFSVSSPDDGVYVATDDDNDDDVTPRRDGASARDSAHALEKSRTCLTIRDARNNLRSGSVLHLDAPSSIGGNDDSSTASYPTVTADDSSAGELQNHPLSAQRPQSPRQSAATFQYHVGSQSLPPQRRKQQPVGVLKRSSFNLVAVEAGPLRGGGGGEDEFDRALTSSQIVPRRSSSSRALLVAPPLPTGKKSFKLSKCSQAYDLDGDGVLDTVEQAMRDRDVEGRGHLTPAQVKQIVEDQLKSQSDIGLYKKVAAGLICLVAILALSNFGTSWATAILAKDTVVESEGGTIRDKKTGEIMSFQETALEFDLEPLTDGEFERRRLLVDAEMAEDPDHPDHLHRHLGKKKKKNGTTSYVAYDHGRMREEDLRKMTTSCENANTVTMQRRWRNGDTLSIDLDTVCDPGTQIVRRGRKKKNKNKTKTKVIDEQVTFRKKGKHGKDASVTFNCEKGYCFGSGGALLQRTSHPCQLQRDVVGASECEEGLVCYSPGDPQAQYGVGTCTSLVRYAKKNQVCNMAFGVDACVSGMGCRSTTTSNFSRNAPRNAEVRPGLCERITELSESGDVCDASFDSASCVVGYRCLGKNGREIRNRGMGLCTKAS